ncbi:MAG: hypothetical protein JSS02_17775 [Planctomycetes bacterium]|nr:hypothetical protein [Planctomycetota bacterium]
MATNSRPSGRLPQIVRALQVRLRFIVVLAVVFLTIGFWGHLSNLSETLWHRLRGHSGKSHAVSIDTEFFCPMCPGVVSDFPAICPVCNMDLIRRKKGEALILPEGVVARMQLSPYRIQLAGIATSVVERRPLQREFRFAGRLVSVPSSRVQEPDPQANSDQRTPDPPLALECRASASDLRWLTPGRAAEINFDDLGDFSPLTARVEPVADSVPDQAHATRSPVVRFRLQDPPERLQVGMYGVARVTIPWEEIEPWAATPAANSATAQPPGVVAVPESAIVDTGERRVVFVEMMPGMFDGVEVTLGGRCGEFYPVLKGLAAGQKVATVGAFLIDAEARLSPEMAAAYFGAARTADPAAGKATQKWQVARQKKNGNSANQFSASDLELIRQQKICPVTDADLDSMGGPVLVEISGQRVFVCCKGCEPPLKANPQKYLAKIKK